VFPDLDRVDQHHKAHLLIDTVGKLVFLIILHYACVSRYARKWMTQTLFDGIPASSHIANGASALIV
jgi:hypothetical protein